MATSPHALMDTGLVTAAKLPTAALCFYERNGREESHQDTHKAPSARVDSMQLRPLSLAFQSLRCGNLVGLVLAIVCSGPVGLVAGEPIARLDWARLEMTVNPPRALPVISTDFPFTNRTAIPVTIVSLVPLCDCLKATPSKKIFAPGESGSIRVVVPIKASPERVVKSLRVTTDWGEATVLRLILDPPSPTTAAGTSPLPPAPLLGPKSPGAGKRPGQSPVTMRSHLVTWKRNAKIAEQVLEVWAAPDSGVTFGKLASDHPEFTARLVASPTWGLHRIVVTPQSTAVAMSGTVRLEATVNGQKRVYSARMVVE